MTKKELRTWIRGKKKQMTQEEITWKSQRLCMIARQSPAYQHAATIYAYLPFNQEVDLMPLLSQALSEGKQVALPKCIGQEMHFILLSDLSRIQYTPFGVPEPADSGPIAADSSACVIVPGLAFDSRGYRVGYGGGYYDRFLAREPNHPTLALCYDFQLVDKLEPDPHDIPVSAIFSA